MFDYSIYGLRLRTNTPLPATAGIACDAAPDVQIELAGVGDSCSMPATVPVDAHVASAGAFVRVRDDAHEYVRLTYAGAGHEAVFLLRADGARVWARWNALVGVEDVASLLTGPVLSCILRLRGLTCLHASVVDIDGRAIAMLGAKGTGKSTTALGLVRAGGRLLSDDVAVIDRDATAFTVRAGHARVRMRPEPAAALCGSFDALQPLWSRESDRPQKRYLELDDAADVERAYPLAGIYLLGRRDDGRARGLTPIAPGAALPLLMTNRHMADIVDRHGHTRDFALLAQLVARVPVRDVARGEGLAHLAETIDAIRDDVARSA